MLIFGLGTGAWAYSYTGSISNGNGLYGTYDWYNAELGWAVDNVTNSGYWTYEYTFTVTSKAISHFIIEVSETFTKNNLICPQVAFGKDGAQSENFIFDSDAPKIYTSASDNPDMPADLFGIK